jgi:hypothetical protein
MLISVNELLKWKQSRKYSYKIKFFSDIKSILYNRKNIRIDTCKLLNI